VQCACLCESGWEVAYLNAMGHRVVSGGHRHQRTCSLRVPRLCNVDQKRAGGQDIKLDLKAEERRPQKLGLTNMHAHICTSVMDNTR
jgi:hypothetical protein